MVTLRDVARECGVSIATVSYCINNSKSVKPQTREKIMTAIKNLGYVPNMAAKTLKTMDSHEIGVVFPDIDDLCHSEILKGIIAGADEYGYTLSTAFSNGNPRLESKIIETLIEKNCAGLIMITCQPQNTDFFQTALINRNIPAVFIERFPKNIDANFLSFDNYKTIYYLTQKLLGDGYTNITLMCGFNHFFSEHEAIRGFTDAHDDAGRACLSRQIIETAVSKEAAFRQTMYRLVQDPPQAVIATSELLAKGLMEAFDLCSVPVPQQTCVITLGEECWNKTNYLPNIIHSSRTSYLLGQQSFRTLISNIRSPKFFEKEFMLFKDSIVDSGLSLPHAAQTPFQIRVPRRTIHILAPSLPSILAVTSVATEFKLQHSIEIACDMLSYRDLFNAIVDYVEHGIRDYDLYTFDVSWLAYFGRRNAFADITDFIRHNEQIQQNVIRNNLDNCLYNNRYIGFPVSGGAQILFYRKDLFDNPLLKKQFESLNQAPLRPPKTWAEFNGIARFFTKEYNPYSPTLYGTSVTGSINEELMLELLIRMWSFGGNIYDSRGKISLNSPQNVRAFQCMLESCRYAPKDLLNSSIDQSFHEFGTGNTAMLISFMEYASLISNFIHTDIVSRIDYAMVPGNTPANVGWNFGMSRYTEHAKLISDFYIWLCRKSTSYYMTTLNGQSVVTCPYQNHEIMKLYPWMALTEKAQQHARSRIYPSEGRHRMIPPYEIESTVNEEFLKVFRNECSVSDALREGQSRLLALTES